MTGQAEWRAWWADMVKGAEVARDAGWMKFGAVSGIQWQPVLALDAALRAAETECDQLRRQLAALNCPTAYTGSQTATAPLEPTARWMPLVTDSHGEVRKDG